MYVVCKDVKKWLDLLKMTIGSLCGPLMNVVNNLIGWVPEFPVYYLRVSAGLISLISKSSQNPAPNPEEYPYLVILVLGFFLMQFLLIMQATKFPSWILIFVANLQMYYSFACLWVFMLSFLLNGKIESKSGTEYQSLSNTTTAIPSMLAYMVHYEVNFCMCCILAAIYILLVLILTWKITKNIAVKKKDTDYYDLECMTKKLLQLIIPILRQIIAALMMSKFLTIDTSKILGICASPDMDCFYCLMAAYVFAAFVLMVPNFYTFPARYQAIEKGEKRVWFFLQFIKEFSGHLIPSPLGDGSSNKYLPARQLPTKGHEGFLNPLTTKAGDILSCVGMHYGGCKIKNEQVNDLQYIKDVLSFVDIICAMHKAYDLSKKFQQNESIILAKKLTKHEEAAKRAPHHQDWAQLVFLIIWFLNFLHQFL